MKIQYSTRISGIEPHAATKEAMIVVDAPFKDTPSSGSRKGRVSSCSHMMSDIVGPDGTAELVAFARSIGMQESWIQYRGKPREHFDLIGNAMIQKALSAGAKQVTGRDLIPIIRSKRAEVKP